MKRYFLIVFLSFLFSCEDIITPDLPVNEPIVVVDAWINNLEKDQVIKLSETQNYLDSNAPVPVVGASIFVYDENLNHFPFIEVNDGEYIWSPDSIFKNLGNVGTKFYLSIKFQLLYKSHLLKIYLMQKKLFLYIKKIKHHLWFMRILDGKALY